jgi:hypothetical protein
MEVISLPMVDKDLSLKSAFEKMRAAGRSGIVWRKQGSEFRLFSAGQLAVEGQNKEKLSDLDGVPIEIVNITDVAKRTQDLYIDSDALHSSLNPSHRYGLLAAGQIGPTSQAVLFAHSSDDVLYLEPSPADCYCSGPPVHKIRCGSNCSLHVKSFTVRVSR